MKVPIWLCHSILPIKFHTTGDALLKEVEQHDVIENEKIKAWQPQQRMLLDTRGFSRKLPPIFRKELQSHIIDNLRHKHQHMSIGYLIPAIIFLINFMFYGFDLYALYWSLIFLAMSLLYQVEYRCGFNTINGIKERALFFNWLFSSSLVKQNLITCVLFGLAIGLIQVFFFIHYGSEDVAFNLYGVMYDALLQNEYWRLITGPTLHYSALHYLNNFLMLSMIGTLCLSLVGYKSIIIFCIGNILGAYFQYLLGSHQLDNCGGISFGIYSLLGLLLGFNLLISKVLPKGFPQSLLVIVIIGLFFSELLTNNSASIGHFTGFLFGIASNLFLILLADFTVGVTTGQL